MNPVPLQRHANLFSWWSCLRWFTHRETPWRERAESQHCLTEPFAQPLSEVHLRARSLLYEVKSRDKSREFKQIESLLLLYSFASSFAWHVNSLDKISVVFLQITSVGQNSASWPKTFLHWPWAVFCSGGTRVSAACSWAVLWVCGGGGSRTMGGTLCFLTFIPMQAIVSFKYLVALACCRKPHFTI